MIQAALVPVMRMTPGQGRDLPPAQRVRNQRRAAREACVGSARRLGLELAELAQDEAGVPLPVDGWHWSVSHTRAVVCGVVHAAPVGIDVERIQPRSQAVVRASAGREEYDVTGGFSWRSFTRVWSAKEAVLKKAGCGLTELSRCTIVSSPSPVAMVVHHRDRLHHVHQSLQHGHVVSITADGSDDAEIHWDWWELQSSGQQEEKPC